MRSDPDCFAGGAEYGQPGAALIEQPPAMGDEPAGVGFKVRRERCEGG